MLIRKTHSFRLARGILLILIALWLSGVLKLTMFNRSCKRRSSSDSSRSHHLPAGAAPSARAHGQQNVPELGSKPLETLGMDNVISQTIAACTQLSSTKTGASSFLSAA